MAPLVWPVKFSPTNRSPVLDVGPFKLLKFIFGKDAVDVVVDSKIP